MTHAAAVLAEGTPNPLAPGLGEIIVGLVFFGLLFFLVKKYVVPSFEATFAARTAAIEGGIAKAEEAQHEAQAALEQYRAQLAEARQEAARIRQEATEQGASIIAEMREQARAEATRITEGAQAQIAADRAQAVAQLHTYVGDLSTQLASRIVGESLEDDERSGRVVDRFLAELESGTHLARSQER